jgi:hypothetical protein
MHAIAVFEEAFGVPAGHTLREVRCPQRAPGPRRGVREWEHEERDGCGELVAVYESWTRGPVPPATDGAGGIVGWVKYSPHGWVLRRAGAPPVGRPASAAAAWQEAAGGTTGAERALPGAAACAG